MAIMLTSSPNAQVWSGRVLQFSREGRQCDHDPSALEVIMMMMLMMLMALVNVVVVMKAKRATLAMVVLLIIRKT